jgi:hypothetical protein
VRILLVLTVEIFFISLPLRLRNLFLGNCRFKFVAIYYYYYFLDKGNIIKKNAKRSQVYIEYTREASKTEKKQEQENHES